MEYKTMDEFWQFFLQVTFHQGNPERWTRRETKALWVQSALAVAPGQKLLDLGCGDGILDIWLSRQGFQIQAVDRGARVIENARNEDDTGLVDFRTADLLEFQCPDQSLDGIFILETLGLMSQEEDLKLLKRCFAWLKPGARVVTDVPVQPSIENNWSKNFPEGRVDAFTSFDKETRKHQLNFVFTPQNGKPFRLVDPHNRHGTTGEGLTRFIYTRAELQHLLEAAGFTPRMIPHYYGESYWGVLGEKTP